MAGYVYILTNQYHSVLYTGVTSNLPKRLFEHKNSSDFEKFTTKYRVTKLVYYEEADSIVSAIEREKQIKAGSRKKKIQLIDSMSPSWTDLAERIV